MSFAKGFRSKMEKMFSSPDQDREIPDDPPPPYSLPSDFAQAGIKEDDLAILGDYDTVIILDDSGSMIPLWAQVGPRHSLGRIGRCLSMFLRLQACRALGVLAEVAFKYDKNGIDIYFLNSSKKGERLKVK